MMKNLNLTDLNLTDLNLSDAFLLFLHSKSFAPRTAASHHYAFKTFTEFVDSSSFVRSLSVRSLSAELILDYTNFIAKTYPSQLTQRTYLGIIQRFLIFLFHNNNLISFDPIPLIKLPSSHLHFRFYPNDFDSISSPFSNNPRNLAILSLFAFENLAPSDVYNLSINDVFFNPPKLRLIQKQIIIPLSDHSAQLISDYIRISKNTSASALFIRPSEKKMTLTSIQSIFKNALYFKKYSFTNITV